MYYQEHAPPHFHARYAAQTASIEIESLAVLRGDLPGRALGLVVEWGRLHRADLLEDWELARQAEPLLSIDPLG